MNTNRAAFSIPRYFLLAELVYKNNILHVYTARAETGGTMWTDVVKSLVYVMLFAHFLLTCYLLMHAALGPMSIMLGLCVADVAFLGHCRRAYEVPSRVAPLEIATLKDQQEHSKGSVAKCQFSNQVYEQPALRLEVVTEEPFVDAAPILNKASSYDADYSAVELSVEGDS